MNIRPRLNKLEQRTGDRQYAIIVGREVDGVFVPNEVNPPIPRDKNHIVVQIMDYSE